eukprot:Nitzschia sp. Nitz4//scaffold265_size26576//11690//12877//NITZ4_008248-RA/size26576-processed-gene-0.35-mRNA-1//-1//CDS//3329544840//4726//frame0
MASSRNGTKNIPVNPQQEPWHVSHWALEPRQRMEERPSESLQSQSFQALHPPTPLRYAQHTAYDVNDEIEISSHIDDTLRESDDEQETSKKSKKHQSSSKKKTKKDQHPTSSSKSKTSSKESSHSKKKKHRHPRPLPTDDDDSDHMYPVDEDSPFAVEFRQTSPNAPAWNAPPATTPIEPQPDDEDDTNDHEIHENKKDGNDIPIQEQKPKEPQEEPRREPGVKFNPEAVVYEMEEESIEDLVEYLQHQHDLEEEADTRGGYGDASNDHWAEFPDNFPSNSADENDMAHGKVKELPISSPVQCTSWTFCLLVFVGFGVGLGIVAWKTYFQSDDGDDDNGNSTLTPTMAVTMAPMPAFATAVPTMARTTSAPVPVVFTPVPTQEPTFPPTTTLEEE